MAELLRRIEWNERRLEARENRARTAALAEFTDHELRVLQVEGIQRKPESEWTHYERMVMREYGPPMEEAPA
jgi:hypothetical protein